MEKPIQNIRNLNLYFNKIYMYMNLPGDYGGKVIPDPIPNSEVKFSCADGTLS